MAPITTLISRFSLIKEFSAVPFTEKPMMNKGTRAPFITTRNSAARQKNRTNSKFQAGAGDSLPPSLSAEDRTEGLDPLHRAGSSASPAAGYFPQEAAAGLRSSSSDFTGLIQVHLFIAFDQF